MKNYCLLRHYAEVKKLDMKAIYYMTATVYIQKKANLYMKNRLVILGSGDKDYLKMKARALLGEMESFMIGSVIIAQLCKYVKIIKFDF